MLVYLVRPRYGETGSERYIKAVGAEPEGGVCWCWSLLVLAALYEAPEVIGQMP